MKNKMNLLALLLAVTCATVRAQGLRNLDKRIERKVNDRINRKVDQAIDIGLDEVEGAGGRKGTPDGKVKEDKPSGKKTRHEDGTQQESAKGKTLAAGSKFDFVPGDKVMALEDFSTDAVGDFPARWDTDASAEVMTLDGTEGKWLGFTRSGALSPDFIKELPENFTLEFDLVVSPGYSYYDGAFGIAIASLKSRKEFNAWKQYGDARRGGQSGVMLWIHPQDAGSPPVGHSQVELWEQGKKVMSNKTGNLTSFNRNRNKVHVAIWRQQQRLRVYLGEEKVWDLPKAFPAGMKGNALVFSRYDAKDDHNFFIGNIRLAVGNPDTRHKLINTGRFSTSGIYFHTGSAQIQSESHGILKEIATVLKENPEVHIQIIGHTDNVGSDAANRTLSAQRAEAVKQYLEKTFGISEDRMTTEGKGAAQPVGSNVTAEGKARNRRVEFVKL